MIEEIVQLTQDLIRFKTMQSRPEEIGRCADFIEAYLTRHNIAYQRANRNGVPSLAVLPAPRSAPVLLMSHIDVVDASEKQFEPYVADGRLYGRGSIDDKYAVAISLVLFKEMLQRKHQNGLQQSDMPFGILITGDEEVGGVNGAKASLEQIQVNFGIALDGGDLKKIVVKEKGLMRLRLTVRGKASHGARPWLGENAIDILIDDYAVIRSYFDETAPDHWHRTQTLSIISAGQSVNQVPDAAEARFDVRFTENDDMHQVLADIKANIKGTLTVDSQSPVYVGGDSPYLDALLEIAEDASLGFEHGASDARYFCQRGIPSVVWGADGEMSQHTTHEHVMVDSLSELYHLLNRFMEAAARIGSTGDEKAST